MLTASLPSVLASLRPGSRRAASRPRPAQRRCDAPLLLLTAAWLAGCTADGLPQQQLSLPPPSPPSLTVSGGCNIALGKLAALNYIVQGRTASGAPYYKAAGWEYWLYWDPDCSGGSRGEAARWIVNYVAPNTTAVRNLDGSSLCIHKGGIDSVDYKHNTTQLNARGKEGCVLSPFKCNFRLLRGLARKGVGMLRFRFVTGAQAPVHVLVPRWRARGE